jgi:HJR/Mrr/RecB family endonuclease
MSRRNNDGDLAFPLLILVVAAAWAHKPLMPKVEHYSFLAGFAASTIFVTVLIIKLVMSAGSWRRHGSPDLVDIDNMTGLEFERYVAQVLGNHGYTHVRLTEEYDLGVDIIAEKQGIRWGIQVKRYSGLVKADAVRQVVTALKFYKCDQAMAITNSHLSNVAKRLANSNKCVLIDRGRL